MAKEKTIASKKHTSAITRRFLLIAEEVQKDGLAATQSEFAESVGEHQQNIASMKNGMRAPTLEHIAEACKKYGYSPTWLILGVGEKKIKIKDQKTLEDRVSELETQISSIRRQIKK